MNELSAPRRTQVSGTGSYEVTKLRQSNTFSSEQLDEAEEKTRRSCDFSRMRAVIAHGGLEKAYTVRSRTTVTLI